MCEIENVRISKTSENFSTMSVSNEARLDRHTSTVRAHRSHSTVQVPLQFLEFSSSSASFLNYKTSDFLYDLQDCPFNRRQSGFKQQMLNAWYAARKKKAFNYDLNCVYKLLDGGYDLSIQLNIERGTLRRKPMRFKNITQPFDHLRFNFTKLRDSELLFHLRCVDRPYTDDKLDLLHTWAVNASPLEKGHALVIPSISKCLPQVLNDTAIRIATDLMLIVEDENFHVLFNSLLGQASVNHLHLHTLFWPYESGIVEKRCEVLHKSRKVFVLRRPEWFIHAFVFQLTGADEFDEFIDNVSKCATFLTSKNVAHNLFITRAPPIKTQPDEENSLSASKRPQYVTMYLFPRRSHTGAKPATNFNPAALELSGFLTAYTYRFFESANEQTALRIIDEDAVLSEEIIDMLCDGLVRRYSGELTWDDADDERSGDKSLLGRQRMFRCYSHCLSKSNAKNAMSEKFEHLDVKDMESLSLNEIDELSDSFHTVTSPTPQPSHQSFTRSKSSTLPQT